MRQLLFLAVILLLAGCPARSNPTPVAASPAMLQQAVKRWPDTTMAQLDRGHTVIIQNCNRCHGWPRSDEVGEEAWPKVMSRMAKKAKLDQQQQNDALRYFLAARSTLSQPNP